NAVTVYGTPAGTALTVSSGLESDSTVFVVPGIGGPVTLYDHVGDTTYLYDGPATDNSRVYNITTSSVTRTGGFSLTINYPNVDFFDESFALFTQNPLKDTINFESEPVGVSWDLEANTGDNALNIGDPVNGMAAVQGDVSVLTGAPANDTLTVIDPAGSSA